MPEMQTAEFLTDVNFGLAMVFYATIIGFLLWESIVVWKGKQNMCSGRKLTEIPHRRSVDNPTMTIASAIAHFRARIIAIRNSFAFAQQNLFARRRKQWQKQSAKFARFASADTNRKRKYRKEREEMTKREKVVQLLTKCGCKEVESRSGKYRAFERKFGPPDCPFWFVGKKGALRTGRNSSNSHSAWYILEKYGI